jgi:hypothetical protein
MRKLIVGSQALANGAVTEHDLRRWYDRMFRDIDWPKGSEPTLLDRIVRADVVTEKHETVVISSLSRRSSRAMMPGGGR